MSSETCECSVILLRGAQAVGKSTAASGLLKELGRGAVVEVDHFRGCQAGCNWHDRHQHHVALTVAAECARAFVAGGVWPVVVVDTFGRNQLPDMQARMDALGLSHVSFSLWADTGCLLARSRQRGDDRSEFERSSLLNEEVKSLRFRDEWLVDTTKKDSGEVVRSVLRQLVALPPATNKTVVASPYLSAEEQSRP